MQSPATISPENLHALRAQGDPIRLVDVRTSAEFADGHAAGAMSIPLDALDPSELKARFGDETGTTEPLYLICASGKRAEQGAQKLSSEGVNNLVLVDGGTSAWAEQGLPLRRTSRLLSLERQTQIALGMMLLLMLAKGTLLHPVFLALIGLLAVGLIIAGVTARCGLAALLARMPWNRERSCQLSSA
jgi:rhodanese-related sulfurtransferase